MPRVRHSSVDATARAAFREVRDGVAGCASLPERVQLRAHMPWFGTSGQTDAGRRRDGAAGAIKDALLYCGWRDRCCAVTRTDSINLLIMRIINHAYGTNVQHRRYDSVRNHWNIGAESAQRTIVRIRVDDKTLRP